MFLQAVTDDSVAQSGDRRLYLAGYLNVADRWARFADAWAEELRETPSIGYLKMVEAQNLRGEFKGWSAEQRDAKLASMARIIRHFKPVSFEVSVSTKEFDRLVKPYAPYGLKTPYFPCIFAVTSSVAQLTSRGGSSPPIDFIFDEQRGVSEDIIQSFEHMKRNLPADARKIINGTPIFRSDSDYLPLQAADMLAWHLRREHESGVAMEAAGGIRGDHHLMSEITVDMLEKWGQIFSKQPGVHLLQTKSQWKKFRETSRRLSEAGFIPPHGTRWKNFVQSARERLARFLRR